MKNILTSGLISLILAGSTALSLYTPALADEVKLSDRYIVLGTSICDTNDVIDAAVISKLKLANVDNNRTISLRPSAVFSDGDIKVKVPVTLDFVDLATDLTDLTGTVFPFVGTGVAIDSDGDTGIMLNTGLDIPLNRQLTGNASANVLFLDTTQFDVTLGVGYNF